MKNKESDFCWKESLAPPAPSVELVFAATLPVKFVGAIIEMVERERTP